MHLVALSSTIIIDVFTFLLLVNFFFIFVHVLKFPVFSHIFLSFYCCEMCSLFVRTANSAAYFCLNFACLNMHQLSLNKCILSLKFYSMLNYFRWNGRTDVTAEMYSWNVNACLACTKKTLNETELILCVFSSYLTMEHDSTGRTYFADEWIEK